MSLNKINKIKPTKFKYYDSNDGSQKRFTMGVMAQDLNEIWPHEEYSLLKINNKGYYSVDYSQLVAPMLKAIQELSEKVNKLELKIKNNK